MNKRKRSPAAASELRRVAEQRLRDKSAKPKTVSQRSKDDLQRLVHELQVHQIELELQNEALKEARTELETAVQRYAGLYDYAPVGYLTLDRHGAIRNVNLRGANLLALERSRLIGRRLGLFVASECRTVFNAFLARVFASHAKESCEAAVSTAEGATLWVHVEAVASEDGKECRAVLADVTARRRMTEMLQFRAALMDFAATHSLEQLLRHALDEIGALTGSPIGFFHFVEPDQNTLSLQAWSSRTLAEFCTAVAPGSHYPIADAGVWVECVHTRQPVIHNDYASLPGRKGLPAGHAAVTRELVVPIIRTPLIVGIVGMGNKPTNYTDDDVEVVSYLADVTWTIIERKRIDVAIQESEHRYRGAADALREAARNKDDFLATLSHELRNPLAPIRNSLYILERVAPGSAEAKQVYGIIDRQVNLMTRLVDDLLDVARLSRGKVRLEREPLDLRELVLRTAEDHRATFAANGVEFEIAIADEELFVLGDRTRLVQVVGNLLSNAAKFSPRGKHTLLAMQRDAVGSEAVIRVKDTGAGIDPAMLAHLFEPFVQAESTLVRSRGGLGIGLALVKGLVEMHGGSASAYSDGLGTGAEFQIRLPLAEDRQATGAEPRTARRAPRRVLVIEDSVDAADSLQVALTLDGHDVVVAHDGLEGIRKAREFRPEVVICDIGLPEADGYEVARTLRADEALRSIYLVAVTGHALPEDLARAKEAGFDQHVAKPPSMEKLAQALACAPAAARSGGAPERAGP